MALPRGLGDSPTTYRLVVIAKGVVPAVALLLLLRSPEHSGVRVLKRQGNQGAHIYGVIVITGRKLQEVRQHPMPVRVIRKRDFPAGCQALKRPGPGRLVVDRCNPLAPAMHLALPAPFNQERLNRAPNYSGLIELA